MNGHIYQTFNENDDKRQFGKTTEALGRWINMNTENSGDLLVLHTDLEHPPIEKPEPLNEEDKDDPVEQLLWKETVKDFITRRQSLVDNLRAVYSVIWGQCSPTMKAKLMSVDDYNTKSRVFSSGLTHFLRISHLRLTKVAQIHDLQTFAIPHQKLQKHQQTHHWSPFSCDTV